MSDTNPALENECATHALPPTRFEDTSRGWPLLQLGT
jgi:hypothetical protein